MTTPLAHSDKIQPLPITYAMACVEIVATRSKEGGTIFCEIIDAWNRPGDVKGYLDSSVLISGQSSGCLHALTSNGYPFCLPFHRFLTTETL